MNSNTNYIGQLDDIGIWNRALDTCEIRNLYQASIIPCCPTYITSNTLSPSQTICSTSNPATFTGSTPSGGNGVFTYSWESSSNQSTWASITGATARDYTPGVLNTNTYFRRVVSSGICPGSTSAAVSVQVASVSITATADTICQGQSVTLTANTNLTGNNQSPCTLSGLPTNLQNGLVGYWPFCGNANDASGNGNNGTVSGATLTTDRFGNANNAYSFDGVDDRIQIPNSTQFSYANGLSLSFWMNINSLPGAGQEYIVFSHQQSSSTSAIGFNISIAASGLNPVINFRLGNGSLSTFSGLVNTTFNLNQWVHVVCLFQSGNHQIYLNGQLINTINSPNAIIGNSGQLLSFADKTWTASNALLFPGYLDDIFVYYRNLSSQEINQLFIVGNQYTWSTSATTQSISVSPSTTSTYSVTVQSGSTSCTANKTIQVTLPVGNNTLSPSQTICGTSTPATFTGSTPSGGNGVFTYSWQSSSNQSTWASITGATARDYTPGLLNANTYFRRVVSSGTCPGSTSTAVSVQVASVSITATADTICQGQSVTLTGNTNLTGNNQSPCTLSGLPTNLQNGLVGYWPFCGNANDASGNGNNGTVSGATLTTDRFGNTNSAYSFDGVSNNISVPNIARTGNSARSIFAWIKSNSLIGKCIVGTGGSSTNAGEFNLVMGYGPGSINYPGKVGVMGGNFTTSGNDFYPNSGPSVNDNIWHNVGVTYDGINSLKVYIDGVLVNSTTITYNTIGQINFLGFNNHNGSQWLGLLDDIIIWNRALNLSEIQQLVSLQLVGNQYTWSTSATTQSISVSPSTTSTYSVTVQSGTTSCTANKTIQVTLPVGNNTLTPSQTICSNSTPATFTGSNPSGGNGVFTYSWESSSNQSTWAPMTAATGRDYTSAILNANTYFRRVVSSGTCAAHTSAVLTVQVDGMPSNNSITGNQTLCVGSPASMLTGSLPNGGVGAFTYQWESSLQNSVWSAVPGLTGQNAQPGVVTQSVYYRRVVFSGSCVPSSSASVWVQADAVVLPGTLSSAQTLCAGSMAIPFNGTQPSGGIGVYGYQWESSSNNISWQALTGATQATYAPGAVTQSAYYRRVVASGVCAPGSSVSVGIQVEQPLPVTVVSNAQTLCTGTQPASLSGSLPTGGTGLYQYQWQSSPDASTWSGISGATQLVYGPPVLNQSVWYRRVVSSGVCAAQTSVAVDIRVESLPGNNAIQSNQTICAGSVALTLTGSLPSGGNSVYVYQWMSAPDNLNWVNVSGATTAGYNTGVLNADAYYRRVIQSGVCAPNSSASVFIRVEQALTLNTIQPTQIICQGFPASVLFGNAPIGGNGQYQYQWQSGTDGSIWTNISGGQSRNYDPGMLSGQVYFRRLVQAGVCAPSSSAWVVVTVQPRISGNQITGFQTLCAGSVANLVNGSNPGGGSGTYTYHWETSPDQFTWAVYPGQTSSVLSPGVVQQSTWYRRVVTSGVCAPSSSTPILITAEQPVGNNVVSPNQTICAGASPGNLTGTIPTGGNGMYQYQWERSTDGLNWQNITGATTTGYLPMNVTQSTYYRRTIASGLCGTFPGVAALIRVESRIGANTIGSEQTLCTGGTPAALSGSVPFGGSGVYQYQWESAPNLLSWTSIPGATQQGYSPGPIQGTTYFRRSVSGGICPVNYSITIRMLAVPGITNNILSGNQTICGSASPAVLTGSTPQGGNGIYTYSWESGTDGLSWVSVPGATQSQYLAGGVSGVSYYRRLVVSGNCGAGISNAVWVMSVPGIGNNQLTGATAVCSGTSPGIISGSLPVGGSGNYQYQWQSSANNQSWVNITGGTQQNYTAGLLSATVYYRRIISDGVCGNTTSVAHTVTVSPLVGNNFIQQNQQICAGSVPQLISGSVPNGGNGQYGYDWQSSGDQVTWVSQVGVTQQDYAGGPLMGNVYYRRVVNSGGCWQVSNAVAIQVRPAPVVSQHPLDQVMHIGGTVQFTVTASGTGISYNWQSDTGNGFYSLSNIGQYSGVNGPVLTVSSVGINNNNQRFRCLLTVGDCKTVTTDAAIRIAVGIADTVMDGVGMVVYPNPGGEELRIRFGAEMEVQDVVLVDGLGRILEVEWRWVGEEIEVRTGSLPSGSYAVRIGTREGFVVRSWVRR